MDSGIEKMLEEYPKFLSSQDLIDLGIYKSIDSCYMSRVRLEGPQWIKLGRKILYSKNLLVEFLTSRMMKKRRSNG